MIRQSHCQQGALSGRIYEDFSRLLFLHAHGEASALANDLRRNQFSHAVAGSEQTREIEQTSRGKNFVIVTPAHPEATPWNWATIRPVDIGKSQPANFKSEQAKKINTVLVYPVINPCLVFLVQQYVSNLYLTAANWPATLFFFFRISTPPAYPACSAFIRHGFIPL